MAKAVDADFGGEERKFLLLLGELRAIQEKCGVGPSVVAQRLARCVTVRRAYPEATILEQVNMGLGDFMVDDVREPILQGLIKGGMEPNAAGKLVRTWIDDRGFQGLVENADLALMVLIAGQARPDDEPGEKVAAEITPETSAA
jgi:hypothetical protein